MGRFFSFRKGTKQNNRREEHKMAEKFLMGNEAIALGALDAGVGFVSG